MITVTFACGHTGQVSETSQAVPVCGCGERGLARVKSRAPRFVGACSGPYCETKTIDPAVVDLTTKGSLKLKESVDG